MKSKNILILIILLAAAGVVWFMMSGDSQNTADEENDNNAPQSQEAAPNKSNEVIVEEVPNSLEGELKNSSDKRRGNYMLLLQNSDRIIYLNTSRDYSSLVGKSVRADIEGSMDDFRLVDIKPL